MTKSLLEEFQAEELKGASAENKFAAKLAACNDFEFARVKSYLFSLGNREQARTPAPKRERTDEDRALDKMSDADFADHMRGLGVNLDASLHHFPSAIDFGKKE
jgi:hypothetical protein